MATNKEELARNCAHWLEQAKRNGLREQKIGAIFTFFHLENKDLAVAMGTVSKKHLIDQLKAMIAKHEGGARIINPWDQ